MIYRKNEKRSLTPAQSTAMINLTSEWLGIKDTGASKYTLDSLVARGLAEKTIAQWDGSQKFSMKQLIRYRRKSL